MPTRSSRNRAATGRRGSQVLFDRLVFVNCPFDAEYKPILNAVLFAIHDCGFVARTALELSGSDDNRLDKITRLIKDSRYSIHDLSRVEITTTNPLRCRLRKLAAATHAPLWQVPSHAPREKDRMRSAGQRVWEAQRSGVRAIEA